MKLSPLVLLLGILVLCGCADNREFAKLKKYLDGVDDFIQIDPKSLAERVRAVTEPADTAIPFLIEKCQASNPKDRITALVALATLDHVFRERIADGKSGTNAIKWIDMPALVERSEEIDVALLPMHWVAWLEFARAGMNFRLEEDGIYMYEFSRRHRQE